MHSTRLRRFLLTLTLPALGVSCHAQTPTSTNTGAGAPAAAVADMCPPFGWQEGLAKYLAADAAFPTQDTATLPTPDCNFHEWSWEAFVWATALIDNNGTKVPRFMTLPTPEDLLATDANAGAVKPRTLKLGARSLRAHGAAGFTEGTGAIVEADGNILIAPNGYPVLASVHMDRSYFAIAQKNLIINGGYESQPQDSTFSVGAAVFKATWLRLDPGQQPPAGAYTTEAQVPVLTILRTKSTVTIIPVPGKFTTATVALVGLHVVGCTENHPEFLWGTFEHKLNAPMTPDNTFVPTGTNPGNFTFYKANTSYASVNIANVPPTLTFNTATQKFSPVNNIVQENATGGENQAGGPANVVALNASGQKFLAGQSAPQSAFANYNLIGTVWMKPNTYNVNSTSLDAVGSVLLANTTAETYLQVANVNPQSGWINCFSCHNPTSYSFQKNPPPLANRLIALSHVLSVGTYYAVPNLITGGAPTTEEAPK